MTGDGPDSVYAVSGPSLQERFARLVPIGELSPASWNANEVTDENMRRIRRSLEEYGVIENLVARPIPGALEVISGNHRLQILQEMGYDSVPVVVMDLSDADARVLAQTLNRTRGRDNPERERELVEFVLSNGVDAERLLSFVERDEIIDEVLLAEGGFGGNHEADPDDAPPRPSAPRSKEGEVYELGAHRLICGDATNPDVLEKLMQGDRAQVMFADPPYGVGYVDKRVAAGDTSHARMINGDLAPDEMYQLWSGAWTAARPQMLPGGAYYVSGPQGAMFMYGLMQSLAESGFPLRHMIIWAKDRLVLDRADYHYQHEPVIAGLLEPEPDPEEMTGEPVVYGWLPGTHSWYGGRNQTSVWDIPRPVKADLHPTMKPVELLERVIRNSSAPGDVVLDPFGGSGTTLVAADRLGRRARLVELDPGYCDVIRARYEQTRA